MDVFLLADVNEVVQASRALHIRISDKIGAS